MLVLVDIYYHRQSWSYIRFNGPLKFHANLFLAMWIFFLKIAITKVHTFDFLTWGKWSFYGIIFLFIIFFVVSQLVFEFSFHRWVVNNLGILQPCLTLQNEKTYSRTNLTGTNHTYFKFLSLDNDWHVCPSFVLEMVIHFIETKCTYILYTDCILQWNICRWFSYLNIIYYYF